MNNYPNYMAGQRYPVMQPMQNYNFQQPMAQMQNVPQAIPQVGEPLINYDFYGVQVRSFEEAQKYPYCCEKPLFLLDAQNEKVYIKKMENGIPSVISYELKEIKETVGNNQTVQTVQKNEQLQEEKQPQIDFKTEFANLKNEIVQILRQDFQKQFDELKVTRDSENKGNKNGWR